MKLAKTTCARCGGEVSEFKRMGNRDPIEDVTLLPNGIFVVGFCSNCDKFDYYKLPLRERNENGLV